MSERHLTFHYTLRDGAGRVLDTSRGGQPLTCVEGAGQVVPGLERFLRALRPGDRRDVAVPPELGYGARDESQVGRVPRAALPVEGALGVGDRFLAGRDRHAPVVTVVALEGDEVVLDANHPLAGQTLHFDVELVSARPATAEERLAARAATGD